MGELYSYDAIYEKNIDDDCFVARGFTMFAR